MAHLHNITFNKPWTIWVHDCKSDDWSLSGYDKLYTIKNDNDLWPFLINLNKLDIRNNQFFIMRDLVTPRWEDEVNINGYKITFRLQRSTFNDSIETLLLSIIGGSILENQDLITGIVFNEKNAYIQMQIWTMKNINTKIFETKLREIIPSLIQYYQKEIKL